MPGSGKAAAQGTAQGNVVILLIASVAVDFGILRAALIVAVDVGIAALARPGTQSPQVVVVAAVGVREHRAGFAVIGLYVETAPFAIANGNGKRESNRVVFTPFVIGTVGRNIGGDPANISDVKRAP